MPCSIHTWSATASKSDSGRKLAVVGKGECSRPGYKLRLERGNPGINPDRKILLLQLIVEPPPTGPDLVTPTSVQYEVKVGSEVAFVSIRTSAETQTIEIRDA
jgi:hypothetical protein